MVKSMLLELTTNHYASAEKASQREQLIHLSPKLDRGSGQNILQKTALNLYVLMLFFWGAGAEMKLEVVELEHP